MILLAFILMGGGSLLCAECFRLSQRGMQGLRIRSPLLYNLRGILQLASVIIMLVAIVILFRQTWWLGVIGIVVAWVGTILHIFAFTRMDPELRAKLLTPDDEDR